MDIDKRLRPLIETEALKNHDAAILLKLADGAAVYRDKEPELYEVLLKKSRGECEVRATVTLPITKGLWAGSTQQLGLNRHYTVHAHKSRLSLTAIDKLWIWAYTPTSNTQLWPRIQNIIKTKEPGFLEVSRPGEARDFYKEACRRRPDDQTGNCVTLIQIPIQLDLDYVPNNWNWVDRMYNISNSDTVKLTYLNAVYDRMLACFHPPITTEQVAQ
jgi:hypothetical protein